MTIVDVNTYTTAPRERIAFSFQRSRTNLPVFVAIDGGEFRPVLTEFTFNVPANPGEERRAVVMVLGEDKDNCRLDIHGAGGQTDTDVLVVRGMPISSARYDFTVS